MKTYSAAEVARALSYPQLIEALRAGFCAPSEVPLRTTIQVGDWRQSPLTLGVMPAWFPGRALAVKLFTLAPNNTRRGLPTIHAQILVFDGCTGVPTALVDGTEVTRRRTAATSALAATYLAREDAETLLVMGTGPQAQHQALAHASIRPIRTVTVWGRSKDKALGTMEGIRGAAPSLNVELVTDVEAACREADIVSCATSAAEPVVFGAWLSPGTMLDLVGSHTPERRECDDAAVAGKRVYVDTFTGALAEAGDVIIPLKKGVLHQADIQGDLFGLCRGEAKGRRTPAEITVFKSVGNALEDLTAALLVTDSAH